MKINWKTISLKNMAGYLSETLRDIGIDTVLVGGGCVTIYTKNRYQSHDLDFVTYEDFSKIKRIFIELGFEYRTKYFRHKDCPWIVEFVSPPVAVGNEPVEKFATVKTSMGILKLLRPIDSVKDRLSSYYHWNDRQSLHQALSICNEDHKIDFSELKRWSSSEGFIEKFEVFLNRIRRDDG